MKANRIDGQATNGKRRILANELPLRTPYSITFFPIYACNFECNYCLHSLDMKKRGEISDRVTMDFELFKKCIDDMTYFPEKIKAIHFAGIGEPLLHKDIDKMVSYVVQKEVAETVDIVTNGMLLDAQLSQNLINAGLTKLRVSIQGVNASKYMQITSKHINFEEIVNNLTYFYKHKENTRLYIKIIDSALDEGDEKMFFEIFGDICDDIAIEHLCPFVADINYKSLIDNKEFTLTANGNQIMDSEICPQPFYSLQIYPDGKCIPCCTLEKPIIVGDCNKSTMIDIWNSSAFNKFRKMHLSKQKSNNKVCAQCQQYKYAMFPEEVLDQKAESLIHLF